MGLMAVRSPKRVGLGLLAITIAAALWAIAAIVARQLFDAGVTPFQLAWGRSAIAAVGLGAVSLGRGGFRWRIDGRVLALGLSLGLVTASYYVAIARISVSAAVVIQYMAPALVVLWTAFRNRKRPSLAVGMAVLLALLGVAMISGLGDQDLRLDSIGLMAAGLSALFFSSYTLLSESLVHQLGATGVMFRGFFISSLFWLAYLVPQGPSMLLFQPAHFPSLLFVGIAGTLVPFSLMCWGIQQMSAERGAIAATLEPVLAALFAWLWLNQSLSLTQILGSVLVLMAVTALQSRKLTNPQI
ncbi:EamA family transporter [Leptolyngbya sp. FACHB-16]|nr:EamA family transporter [Leptolyngbya sp. FACHB-8]MBD2158930.1 EamA family transporter [Leptolyngbya sp. FACHB-16]